MLLVRGLRHTLNRRFKSSVIVELLGCMLTIQRMVSESCQLIVGKKNIILQHLEDVPSLSLSSKCDVFKRKTFIYNIKFLNLQNKS